MNNIKVSVIIPVYNVEEYLRECLDSVINQTLKEIEIICVNDGSTDGSLAILNEYANKDSRIKILSKSNSGYGNTMNVGINAASGEFINFLESDDLIEQTMFEELYNIAHKNKLDIIKADYYEYYGETNQLKSIHVLKDKFMYGKVLSPKDNLWLFYVPMMNCLGFFRREFIESNNIRHNETPGASHQDMGFWFQTFCFAESIYYYNKPFYKYRQDNMSSSMNTLSSLSKIYCVRDEYRFIFDILKKNPNIRKWVIPVFYHRMFGSAWFRFNNFVDYLKPLFLHVLTEDLSNYSKETDFTLTRFSENEKKLVESLLLDCQGWYLSEIAGNKKIMELETKVKELVAWNRLLDSKQENIQCKDCECTVSVIIPVYNTEKYLEECLDSIVFQTLKNIEIICINDGSTDNSYNILVEYAKKDNRIRIINQSNMGQSAARNRGLEIARGKYVYFMDSDDWLEKNALECLTNISDSKNLQMLYFDGKTFFESDKIKNKYSHMIGNYERINEYNDVYTGLEMFIKLKYDNKYRVCPVLCLFSKDFLIESKINFYEGIIYEDNLFSFNCVMEAKRVSHIKANFFHRRIREDSTTTQQYSWKHFYGYFICFIEMLYLCLKYPITDEEWRYVNDELMSIKNGAVRNYRMLPPTEKNYREHLNKIELVVFNYMFNGLINSKFINKTDFGKKPNKIVGCYRCLKNNGFKYTVHRIILHLIGKAR